MDATRRLGSRGKRPAAWLIWFLVLFLLDFLVPFVWLSSVQKVTGAFLFWTIWTVVAIVSMFAVFLRWRE
jgi:uncharacterized membrane protein YedE/YeeE